MKKNTLTIIAALLMATTFFAQTVTTFTEGTPDDGIAIDNNGNIYCSNYVGDTVFKFTPSGDATPFITGLNTPNGLAFNSNQDLYVCDGQGNTIYKYDINGALLDSYPTANHPSGIIKSFTNEDMIFTQFSGDVINRLEPDGTITTISAAPELNGPVGLAYDSDGDLYVGNYTDREIYRVLANGDLEYIATVPTDGGALPNLGFIAFGQGFLWGTTMGSDKIFKINPNGVDDFELFAGSTQGSLDGDISEATFHTPNGIAFNDAEDTMYITDFGSKNLRIISDIELGIGDQGLNKNRFLIFPNPAEKVLHIKLKAHNSEEYSIKIINPVGEIVFSSKKTILNNIEEEIIQIDSLNSGVYFVTLSSKNYSEKYKIIKK